MCCAAVAAPTGEQAVSAQSALESARKTAVVDGNLPAAIKQYQAIADRYAKTDRAAAAEALLRMADAYQKLGDAQARTTYERIVRDYADQATPVATARGRLASLEWCASARRHFARSAVRRLWRWRFVDLSRRTLACLHGLGQRGSRDPRHGDGRDSPAPGEDRHLPRIRQNSRRHRCSRLMQVRSRTCGTQAKTACPFSCVWSPIGPGPSRAC